MFFPYPVIEQMTEDQVSAWNEHFTGGGHERRRDIEEGIWRRTQEPANAEQSGWSPNNRGRRRVVHYRYEFGINRVFPVPRLTLDNLYLTVSFTAPAPEITAYRRRLAGWLADGRWRRLGSCGGCLPKDVRAFTASAARLGADDAATLLRAAERINENRPGTAQRMIEDALGGRPLADPAALRGEVASPVVVDLRNVLDAKRWRAAGWTVHQLGRPQPAVETPAGARELGWASAGGC